MAKPAENDLELYAMIEKDIKNSVQEMSIQTVLLTKMFVQERVYDAYTTVKRYVRLGENGGFLGSWDYKLSPFSGGEITSNIFSNPKFMILNPSEYQHGTIDEDVFSIIDRRGMMSRIIVEGTEWDFGANAGTPRDYWTPVEAMTQDGTLDNIFENELMSRKIQFIKI